MKTQDKNGLFGQLSRMKRRQIDAGDHLVGEARRILHSELFTEANILRHLGHYNALTGVVEEQQVDASLVFGPDEIRQACVVWRLKFLSSKTYKPAIPYEAVLRIKALNSEFAKELEEFMVVATPEAFADKQTVTEALLFTKTDQGNYYLVHRWGEPVRAHRRWLYWPMRHFENLLISVMSVTAIIALCLPTWLITLDDGATYWSGYRAAAFFHLLIFNLGVTAYFTFTFAKNFSATVWNREQDFG